MEISLKSEKKCSAIDLFYLDSLYSLQYKLTDQILINSVGECSCNILGSFLGSNPLSFKRELVEKFENRPNLFTFNSIFYPSPENHELWIWSKRIAKNKGPTWSTAYPWHPATADLARPYKAAQLMMRSFASYVYSFKRVDFQLKTISRRWFVKRILTS